MYLPYAKWLAASDRFEEARKAFRSGGRPDLATDTLEQLTANAVAERRYADASYCHYQLAMEALGEICRPPAAGMSEADQTALERFSAMYDRCVAEAVLGASAIWPAACCSAQTCMAALQSMHFIPCALYHAATGDSNSTLLGKQRPLVWLLLAKVVLTCMLLW